MSEPSAQTAGGDQGGHDLPFGDSAPSVRPEGATPAPSALEPGPSIQDPSPSAPEPGATEPPSRTDRIEAEAARLAANVRRINREVNARSGRNLLTAIGVGAALAVVMLGTLLLDTRLFAIVAAIAVVLVTLELSTAMRRQGRHVSRIPSAIVAAAVVLIAYTEGPVWQWVAMLSGLAFVMLWRVVELYVNRERRRPDEVVRDFTSTAFVQFYVVFLGSFIALLAAQPNGAMWVLGFMIMVIAADTGAYAVGVPFGKHKMAPAISPGKTWEGILGGLLLAMIAGALIAVFMLQMPWWFGALFGAGITVSAVAGDLTESMIKRDIGVKDISNWLPGHGGFFDRFDSMLPSGAIAFAFYFWSAPINHLLAQ